MTDPKTHAPAVPDDVTGLIASAPPSTPQETDMTDRTLRDRIAALRINDIVDQDDLVYNLAIGDALRILDTRPAPPAIADAPVSDRPGPDAVAEAPVCRCGGAMSKNPHPDAGKPFTLLETGPVWVCIPCQSGTLHRWSERAHDAETRIAAAKEALAKGQQP